ncbi:BatA and WFA domain-containing protein [Bremerella sp. JC817]|uniref:vWA domain-containing protein n=1 Tax=Bremerella sp. JC817 TaxID=3231756 RepID=UPI003458E8AA
MTFSAPWIFGLGIAAATAPVLIHWLTRPRPVKMPLSTLRFVREAIQQRSAVDRLRDWIILALRCLAILLLAAAFAGPQWTNPTSLTQDEGDAIRVVVLDVSQSMAASDGTTPGIQRARSFASRYLQYRPGLKTNLIVAGARPAAVFDNVSTNFESLLEEVARAEVLPERMDVDAALELAAKQLAATGENDTRRRELIVISDFQRSGWGAAKFNVLPANTEIQLESTAPETAPDNMAIVSATCQPVGAQQDRMQLEVRVGNFSGNSRNVTVEANIGESVHRLEGSCAPRQVTLLTQEIPTTGQGWQSGQVRLLETSDAVAADNWRPIVAQLRGRPQYVMVSSQGNRPGIESSRILACALVPELTTDSASDRFRMVRPELLDNQSFAGTDLIAVNAAGRLSPEHLGMLAQQIRRGKSVLYVASESIDAANLDQLAEMAAVELPIRFAPPRVGTSRSDLHLVSLENPKPPLASFGDSLTALAEPLRFSGGLSIEAGTATGALSDDRIRATLNDGTPAIVVARSGSGGTLAILNADLAASNMWKTGALVPLMDELVQELLESDDNSGAFLCGEPIVARIETSAAADSLAIATSDSGENSAHRTETAGKLVDEGGAVVWQWSSPDRPGVYRIEEDGDTLFAAAVALPPEESDLETLSAEVVKDRLAAGYTVRFQATGGTANPDQNLWQWFVVGVVLCMFGELAALMAYRT